MSQGLTAVSRLVRPEEGESRSRAPDRGELGFSAPATVVDRQLGLNRTTHCAIEPAILGVFTGHHEAIVLGEALAR